jgi:hypothetical protein
MIFNGSIWFKLFFFIKIIKTAIYRNGNNLETAGASHL